MTASLSREHFSVRNYQSRKTLSRAGQERLAFPYGTNICTQGKRHRLRADPTRPSTGGWATTFLPRADTQRRHLVPHRWLVFRRHNLRSLHDRPASRASQPRALATPLGKEQKTPDSVDFSTISGVLYWWRMRDSNPYGASPPAPTPVNFGIFSTIFGLHG